MQDIRNIAVKTNKREEIKISSPEIRDVSWGGVFKEIDECMDKIEDARISEEALKNAKIKISSPE